MNTETEPQQQKCNFVYIQLNSRYEQILLTWSPTFGRPIIYKV